jgi:hypothetical protein
MKGELTAKHSYNRKKTVTKSYFTKMEIRRVDDLNFKLVCWG